MPEPIISIQGRAGSFHHIAASRLFADAGYLMRSAFEQVFRDCAGGEADYALVAIENSIAGSLTFNYNLLARYGLPIVGETYLRISHQLIGKPGNSIGNIREIWSHPMAIEQCREFLNTTGAIIVEKEDTAGSVELIRNLDLDHTAAIASREAAALWDMEIIAADIETDPNNYTRFLLLSRENKPVMPDNGYWKTSLHFGFSDRPGGLVTVLNVFAARGINMSKIESRPRIGSPWKYDFFTDIEYRVDGSSDPLITDLNAHTDFLHILGSYPCTPFS